MDSLLSIFFILIRSIFSPLPLNILPLDFPHAIKMHFSSFSLLMNQVNHPHAFLKPSYPSIHTKNNLFPPLFPYELWATLFQPLTRLFSFFSRWALTSCSAVATSWVGLIHPFYNKWYLDNAAPVPCHLFYHQQYPVRHLQESSWAHTIFFSFSKYNHVMLLSLIYGT